MNYVVADNVLVDERNDSEGFVYCQVCGAPAGESHGDSQDPETMEWSNTCVVVHNADPASRCNAKTVDGNRDDPDYYYCDAPWGHAGSHHWTA